MYSFKKVYDLLVLRGPGRAISSRGTIYRIEAMNGNIVAFPKRGRVTIHKDCWGNSTTCSGTRAGGIYNGSFTVYDWYRDNS